MVMTIKNYLDTPVSSANVYAAENTTFPDVTICALQPQPRSVRVHRKNVVFDHDRWKNFKVVKEVVKEEWGWNVENLLSDQYAKMLQMLFAMFWASEDTRALGHEDDVLVVWCRYKGERCTSKQFKMRQNWQYWNCYTFRPPDRTVYSDRKSLGLQVIVYTNEYLYQDSLHDEDILRPKKITGSHNISILDFRTGMAPSGVRVVIHNEDTYPFAFQNGVNIANGMSATITFSMERQQYYNRPLKPCSEHVTAKASYITAFGGKEANFEKLISNFTSSTDDHLVELQQKYIFEKCNCYTHTLPFVNHLSKLCYHVDEPTNKTVVRDALWKVGCHETALDYVHQKGASMLKAKGILQPCDSTDYDYNVNTAPWPNHYDARTLINNYVIPNLKDQMIGGRSYSHLLENSKGIKVINDILGEMKDDEVTNKTKWKTRFDVIKKNFIKFNIHAISPFSTRHEENPSYSIWEAFAEIGGIFGLYIGITLLTVCELVELMVMVVHKRMVHHRAEDTCPKPPEIMLEGAPVDEDEENHRHDYDEDDDDLDDFDMHQQTTSPLGDFIHQLKHSGVTDNL